MNKTKTLLIIVFCFLTLNAFALRPVGHVILKDKIVNSLPTDNRFRIAMEKYPNIASWGAVGPDLGYNIDLTRTFKTKWKRQIKNSMQLADLAHYHKVGTFVKKLIEKAYSQNDERFFAFVGGWITHIAGDFASHGIYVKEEAGFYIAFEGGRDIHSELENLSDAYLFSKYANTYCLSSWEYNSEYYWQTFFGIKANPKNKSEKDRNRELLNEMIGGNVEESFIKVYKETYELDDVKFSLVNLASTYSRSIGEGLGKYAGFKQYTVMEALDKMLIKDRKKRIDSAFNVGIDRGNKYLTEAVTSKPTYSDSWNLDIGENGEPTYIIRIDPGKSLTSRTKNDLFVTLKSKDGRISPEINITSKYGPLKFAFYQEDTYYYSFNLGGAMGELDCWKLENVESAILSIRPKKHQPFGNTFKFKQALIYYNGKVISIKGDLNSPKLIKLKKTDPIEFKIKD